MLPENWNDVLGASAFIISMDHARYGICEKRAARAGYQNLSCFPGVNRDSEDDLRKNWDRHPFLPHHRMIGQHPSAVMLAHLNLWRHIIDNHIPFCTIFEDDVLFHSQWDLLAHRYYNSTPKQCDMIFMGHHCGNAYPEMHIAQVPVYCLNAYIVALDGAKRLYEMITRYPYDDFGVIDMMLARMQSGIVMGIHPQELLVWYAWNTQMFPDPGNERYKHPGSLEKDMGLVFQQYPFFDIETDQ